MYKQYLHILCNEYELFFSLQYQNVSRKPPQPFNTPTQGKRWGGVGGGAPPSLPPNGPGLPPTAPPTRAGPLPAARSSPMGQSSSTQGQASDSSHRSSETTQIDGWCSSLLWLRRERTYS